MKVSVPLSFLKSQSMQRKVDKRIRELNGCSHLSGTECSGKYKSKRGGNVDIPVKNKVLWPHEAILGGINRQRVTYDHLSLTQWVQGFCKNILDEKSSQRRNTMVSYLGDLMEDATDFTWQGAKAAHAVLMCEMERGSLQWEDTDQIDRIRRAHAQNMLQGRGVGLSHQIQVGNHGSVKTSNLVTAPTLGIMSLMGDYKNTYVLSV